MARFVQFGTCFLNEDHIVSVKVSGDAHNPGTVTVVLSTGEKESFTDDNAKKALDHLRPILIGTAQPMSP